MGVEGGGTTRQTGTVKWFNPDKGFGFIGRGKGEKDIFLHLGELKKSGFKIEDSDMPVEGDTLAFDIENTPGGRGPKAVNIARVAGD